MAKKTTLKKVKEKPFKDGDSVIVFGGGLNTNEFERGTPATIETYSKTEELYLVVFDDDHYDWFCHEQLRKDERKRVGMGAM